MIKEAEKFADSSLMEGIVSVRAVVDSIHDGTSDRKIERIFFSEEKVRSKAKELSWLRFLSSDMNFPLEIIPGENLDAMCIGNTHGGVAMQCSGRTIPSLSDAKLPEHGFYMMLEGIEDPYNFGYALRSIYAAGADGIILPPRNWMTAAGVVCRASAGASERFSLYTADSGADAADFFHANGYKVICADIENSVSMYDADLTYPVFLIVGGEKRGISRAVLDRADAVVRLDYGREFHGALSAASASSILAYEIFRQNRKN
ncbi:MAG: RNA methyltransferase [Clostridia bacterium]|nr:RNA methyltransferase [Clostridia bacterium]